ASLVFKDTDGTTTITTVNHGNIASPGSSANKKVFVKNEGDQTAQSVTLTITAIGTNDGADWALVAPDSGGSPGSFVTTPLSLGNIAAAASVAFWFKETLPSALTADLNPRRYDLVASGSTI